MEAFTRRLCRPCVSGGFTFSSADVAASPMSQTQLSEQSYIGAMVAGDSGEAPDAAADPIVMGLKRSVWIQIGVISALFAGLFWPNLRRLWDKTNPFYGEANWGHAICIPVIGLYYLYVNREKLLSESVPGMATRSRKAKRVWGLLAVALILPLVLIREEASRQLIPVAGIVAVLLAAAAGAGACAGPTNSLIEPTNTLPDGSALSSCFSELPSSNTRFFRAKTTS